MNDIQKRIIQLNDQVADLRYRYHELNDPEVTDEMYQSLNAELVRLQKEHPEFAMNITETTRVAGKPLEKFQKVTHEVRQWSFDDAFGEEDITAWEKKIAKMLGEPNVTYAVERKIDGIHIVLTYVEGKLVTGATRGDGQIGEDVTENVKMIRSVPLTLSEPLTLTVEGEIWMPANLLAEINKEREERGEPLYANPRNVAAGTMRQLDPAVVKERKLEMTAYDISLGDVPETQEKEIALLASLGFQTNAPVICHSISKIMRVYHQWQEKKHTLPYWIDGLVVKVNRRDQQEALGYTGKSPRFAIALKFPADQLPTKIREVYFQVGRTGVITPVAHMDPVQLAGTTVTHATLHNFEEIERLGAKIGDTVIVEKAGDIIPKVIRVLDKLRTGAEQDIVPPTVCPACGGEVQKKEGQVALFCINPDCSAKSLQKIIHFVSKKAYNIDGLGKKIVEQLLDEGLITKASDLFILTKEQLLSLDGFQDKSAENLLAAIASAKHVSFDRFILALGIRHVGEETSIELAKQFASLEDLMNATEEKLQSIADIGDVVAESIMEFFLEEVNVQEVKDLMSNGVTISYPEIHQGNSPLLGKTIVITGTLSEDRDVYKAKIREAGGKVGSTVSKQTSYVLVGAEPGSKAQKAKDLGIPILDETAFLALL